MTTTAASETVNVASRLSTTAKRDPRGMAIAVSHRPRSGGPLRYEQLSFQELDDDSNRIADGLLDLGMKPGMRIVLMVRPGIDFISLVFAMFKAGLVVVLIDPGMGRKNLVRCLEEVAPQGFVAIPLTQAIRILLRKRFPQAKLNVTVGRRWFWGGPTLARLRARRVTDFHPPTTKADDPAAIIFTTGSTGPPKGVLYSHGNFVKQTEEIRDRYEIQPGEIDLPGFPLFALFNCAMGVSTVVPDMDPTRPADVDPRNIIEPIKHWNITQSFGSPALWNTVGRYCEQHQETMPSLRRVLSAGAPVPPHVLRRIKSAIHPEGEMHTPYGATEALPVASTSATEVLEETESQSREGAGTCVGRRFPGITWKVISITDEPLNTIDQVEPLPHGEIGELIVQGEVVTRQYVTRTDANPLHKIQDGNTFWHRMGDVGYLDDQDRFWFCGRKSHRVQTAQGTMFTIPCEAIFNCHEKVYRSALVGVGAAGRQQPAIVVEPWPEYQGLTPTDQEQWLEELRKLAASNWRTNNIQEILIHPSLPVDIRHNSKIFREKLSAWAREQLEKAGRLAEESTAQ